MNKRRDTFLMTCGLLLVAACLLTLFSSARGLSDVMAIKEYKTREKDGGLANIDLLTDGINQLMENEEAYVVGVGTYTAGLASYAAGQKQLAEASKQLSAGEASYAAGKQILDANTDAYNQGKAKLSLVAPAYELAKATGVDPLGIVGQYEDGQKQIQQYEYGQKQLAEGRQNLLDGYDRYNAGVDSLNAGAAKLASGKKQLDAFEQGEDQVASGLDILLAAGPVIRHDGTTVEVPGVADRLGEDYSYWALNGDSSIKKVNGHNYLNLLNCLKACDAGKDFINEQTGGVTRELTGRGFLYMASLAVCLAGIITGIMGAGAAYAPKKPERTALFGGVCSALTVGDNVYGLIGGYAGYTYPMENGDYSGTLQFIALVVLAAAALAFAASAFRALSAYNAARAAESLAPGEITAGPSAYPDRATGGTYGDLELNIAETGVEAAPAVMDAGSRAEGEAGFVGEGTEKLHSLEREETELKEMLASLPDKTDNLKRQED